MANTSGLAVSRGAFAGGDGYGAGQGDVLDPVTGGAADGVVHGQRVVGIAEAAHDKRGVLRAAIGVTAADGSRPITPRWRRIPQLVFG